MNDPAKKSPFINAAVVILCAWVGFVIVRFFREFPYGLQDVWWSIRNFRVPLFGDLYKLIAAFKHLFILSLLLAIGLLAGRRVLRLLGVMQRDRSEDKWTFIQNALLALGLGWGALMYLVLLLSSLRILYPGAVWGLLVVLFVICLPELRSLFAELKMMFSRARPGQSGKAVRVMQGVGVVALLLLAIVALSPDIPHDAMVYHLNIPRLYVKAHGIVPLPYNVFSNMFLNTEMLYSLALSIDDYQLANLIHYAFGVATVLFLYASAVRICGNPTAVVAALMFLLSPIVLLEMPVAWVDVAMVFYFLLALECLLRWRLRDDGRYFVLLGIFGGIFAGIKYMSFPGIVSLCALIAATQLVSQEKRLGRTVRSLALFTAIVTAFVSPYLMKNYLITGNPVYPVAYSLFGGRWLTADLAERIRVAHLSAHLTRPGWWRSLGLPWEITMHPPRFGNLLTPLWLMLLPFAAFIRPRTPVMKGTAVVCAVYFLVWACLVPDARFLMPIFPLLSLLCAWAVVGLPRNASLARPLAQWVRAGLLAVCGLIWGVFVCLYVLPIPSMFGPVVWGAESREEFLSREVPNFAAFQFINESLPADARLLFIFENRGFFCDRPYIGDTFYQASGMLTIVRECGSAAAFRERLREMGITHILLNWTFRREYPAPKISERSDARLMADLDILDEFMRRYCVRLFSSDGAVVYAVQ